jgi:hypothetical protein
LRITADHLAELKTARLKIQALDTYIAQLQSLELRATAVSQQELEVERRLRGIAEKERDVERIRADQLEMALKLALRRPSIGCRILRIFTLGLARCQ